MSDNLQAPSEQAFALPDHGILVLKGRDAATFAQAQFMNDVALLDPRQWQWNGWLSPKGRVIALFALLKLDAETLWLLLPDAAPAALAAQLQRYVFRSKVELQARDDLHVTGTFAAPAVASNASFASDADGTLELDLSAAGNPRNLRIGNAIATTHTDALARWRCFDLAHGLPRLPAAQAEQWTPQQLSLDRLRAFSVKKGCYPGQEIVARTHFLGKAKRGLVRLQGTGVGELDDVMAGDPQATPITVVRAIGSLVCAEGEEGLAVLPLDAGDGPFWTGDCPCVRLPLLDGLAR